MHADDSFGWQTLRHFSLRLQNDLARQPARALERALLLEPMGLGGLGEVHHAVHARRSLPSAIQRLMSSAALRCSSADALNIAKPWIAPSRV